MSRESEAGCLVVGHPLVLQMLGDEPDVRVLAERFLREEPSAPSGCRLALPASVADLAMIDRRENFHLPSMPEVGVTWRRIRHPQTGELGLQFDMSDADLELLARAYLERRHRALARARRMN